MNLNAALTKREFEIAELMAWGQSKKEVASRLFISTRTVENHARIIFRKAQIQKATELCVWYFCKNFSIPLSLSPLKKALVAAFLLLVFIPFELHNSNDLLRNLRTSNASCRSARRTKSETLTIEI